MPTCRYLTQTHIFYIYTLSTGDISIGDVITVLPFRNTVDIVEMKGKHVLGMLENSVAYYSTESDKLFGGFLQVSGKYL